MNDHVVNWNKTRTNSYFGHRVGAYLELLGARGYLFQSLILPHSLHRIKDFGIQLTNSALFAEIYIFLKWVLFPTWNLQTGKPRPQAETCIFFKSGPQPKQSQPHERTGNKFHNQFSAAIEEVIYLPITCTQDRLNSKNESRQKQRGKRRAKKCENTASWKKVKNKMIVQTFNFIKAI